MKRVFVFSYHGKDTFQTSYYRLLSLAGFLSKNFEVYFIHGCIKKPENPIDVKGNFRDIPLNYTNGIIQNLYNKLLKSNRFSIAKILLILYYFLTGKEIFDLGKEFSNYMSKTNLVLNENDTVIVSYPSIAIHNLGNTLKKRFKCNLILDYRDPGVFGYQHISENQLVSRLRKFFLKRREIKNLENADKITAISESIKELFPEKFKKNIEVIRNGFYSDKADLSKIITNGKIFKLVYLGTIYPIQLEDETFFRALRKFIDANNILPKQFQLKFVGADTPINHTTYKMHGLIKQYSLDPYTIITERTPVEIAYKELYDANMFFHLKYGNIGEIITTKQYEYLAFQKPILLPMNDFGDLEKSIEEYDAGYVCNSVEDILNALNLQFELHKAKISNKIIRSEQEVHQLSRKYQEERFESIINNFKSHHQTKILRQSASISSS